jgi:hypothetical protein
MVTEISMETFALHRTGRARDTHILNTRFKIHFLFLAQDSRYEIQDPLTTPVGRCLTYVDGMC